MDSTYIEVPDGALPPGVTASVAVKIIFAGQFELPEDSQLISPIYWVSSNNSFLKELTVNIQHGAVITSEKQCTEFKFIVAECSQEVLPYKFKKKVRAYSTLPVCCNSGEIILIFWAYWSSGH